MRSSAWGRTSPGNWLAAVAAVALAAGVLAGCATRPDAGRDIATASDQTDAQKRARIRMELAVGYFQQGKTDIALDELKQALANDPDYAAAYNLRGLIYMRLNDNELAEESFRRAASINPRDGDVQHNRGWLLCQQARYADAQRAFDSAMAAPGYTGGARTLMAQGVCQARAGHAAEAERSLGRAYELDPSNPVTGYNLASLLYRRGEVQRARFYIRRINNGEFANAESLWLGIRVERKLDDQLAARQLGDQLKKRFPSSREAADYERGMFND